MDSVYVISREYYDQRESYSTVLGLRRSLPSAWDLMMKDSKDADHDVSDTIIWKDYPTDLYGNIKLRPGKYGMIDRNKKVINGIIVGKNGELKRRIVYDGSVTTYTIVRMSIEY